MFLDLKVFPLEDNANGIVLVRSRAAESVYIRQCYAMQTFFISTTATVTA